MIRTLELYNFKCFREVSISLGNLNVLAGTNGSGKSTVLQSLLAVRQSFESDNLRRGRIQLNGKFVEIGTTREAYSAEPSSDSLAIHLISDGGTPSLRLRSEITGERSQDYFLTLSEPVSELSLHLGLFSDLFNYLHAERIGPRKVFQILPEEIDPLCVGKFGENAPYILSSPILSKTPVVNEAVILEASDGKEYPTLQIQSSLWMAKIFPGWDIQSDIFSGADQGKLAIALQKSAATGQALYVRPTNTGFGLSYVLGIIVAGLVARPDTLLLVENPEAHLHPAAQSTVGEFLARVASSGAQVFVETHSEHVLNGIRRMVKQGIVDAGATRLTFFSKSSLLTGPMVQEVPITANGDIRNWPDGFFDQLDKDLNIILE